MQYLKVPTKTSNQLDFHSKTQFKLLNRGQSLNFLSIEIINPQKLLIVMRYLI